MKIVISSNGPGLDSTVDPRFGRAAFLLIINSDNGELVESIDNSAGQDAAQGAGIRAAGLVAEKGVQAILTGRLGPKAMAVVEKTNIKVVDDVSGTVRNAIDTFRSQEAGGPEPAPNYQGQATTAAVCSKRPGRGGGGRGRGKCGRA
jgi:predicted Fe-Mo cluster-binding NifX family protein